MCSFPCSLSPLWSIVTYTGLSTEPLTLNISCSINSAKKKSCRSLNLDPAIDFLALFLFHGNVILDSPTAHPPHYNWELWLCWKQLRHHDQRCFSVTQIVFGQQPFSFSKQNWCWKVFRDRKGVEEGMVLGVGTWIEDRGGETVWVNSCRRMPRTSVVTHLQSDYTKQQPPQRNTLHKLGEMHFYKGLKSVISWQIYSSNYFYNSKLF